jgi:hypothetical protein
MTTTDQFQQAAMQRLVERGGLATFKDLEEMRRRFAELAGVLDVWATDAGVVSLAWSDDREVPFPVENEHVATLTLAVREVRAAVEELGDFADVIEEQIHGVDAARRVQASRDA